jgi:hypothetical protein
VRANVASSFAYAMPPKVAVPDVATMVSDITEMNLFIRRQGDNGRDCTAIAQTHAAKFSAKVALMALTAAQANTIQMTFDDGSFTDAQKTTFSDALANVIGMGGSTVVFRGGGGSSPCQQKIQIELYMPEVFLITVLPDPAIDIAIKTQHFANLFSALECMYADETSRSRAAILLATIGLNNQHPTVDTLHNLHNDLADAITNLRKSFTPTFPHLKVFPTDATLLGDERLAHAYADVRPCAVPSDVKLHLQRFSRVAFLRSTASGVSRGGRRGAPATAASAPTDLMDGFRDLINTLTNNIDRRPQSLRDRADVGGGTRRSLTGFDRRQPLPLMNRGDTFMDCINDTPTPRRGGRSPSRKGRSREPSRGSNRHRERTRSIDRCERTRSRDRRERTRSRERPHDLADRELSPARPSYVDSPSALDVAAEVADAVREASVNTKAQAKAAAAAAKAHAKALGAPAAAKPVGAVAAGLKKKDKIRLAAKGGGVPVLKKPAAAIHASFAKRPKVMDGTAAKPPGTLHWGGGKLTMSFSKGGYRCFPDLSVPNPVDRCFTWTAYGSKNAAWDAALDYIQHRNRK